MNGKLVEGNHQLDFDGIRFLSQEGVINFNPLDSRHDYVGPALSCLVFFSFYCISNPDS